MNCCAWASCVLSTLATAACVSMSVTGTTTLKSNCGLLKRPPIWILQSTGTERSEIREPLWSSSEEAVTVFNRGCNDVLSL